MANRCETINVVCKNLLETLISKFHQSLFYDSENTTGIFGPLSEYQRKCIESDQMEYTENLGYIQNGLKIYKKNIVDKMKVFITAKDELLNEVMKFNKYMESVVLIRVPAVIILSAIISAVTFCLIKLGESRN